MNHATLRSWSVYVIKSMKGVLDYKGRIKGGRIGENKAKPV
jgi:hypothetical protein